MGGTNVEAPTPRDYGSETRDTLQAQVDLAPELYAAQARFGPLYQDLDLLNERLDGAAVPSLVIVAVGLLPVILVCRGLGAKRGETDAGFTPDT